MINSPLIIILVLFLNSFAHSATIALPTARIEEDRSVNDLGFNSVLGEDVVNAAVPMAHFFRRFPVIEGRMANEDGTKRIFIISDLESTWFSKSDAASALGRVFPMLSPWSTDHALAATQKEELQNGDDVTSMVKRDQENKLLRCMIGRVYRPCWQA